MFTNKALENMGIEVTTKVEDNNVIEMINQISTRLLTAFPNNNLSYINIYKTLLDTPMYYAKIPKGLSKANYYYANSTMYFSEDMDLSEIDEYIFHEFVHRLQEHKDKRGNITRIGLCEVNELTVKATALNEGAVQYIVAEALNIPKKEITIYGITLNGNTEYYPLITNLISQLAFLLGKNILIDSTINGNENFKIEIIDNIGENEYNLIEKNTNEILEIKNNILELKKSDNREEGKILENIELIRKLYFDTQDVIFRTYFDKLFKRVENIQEINLVKKKLYEYKNLIGKIPEYQAFNDFCMGFEIRSNAKIDEFKKQQSLIILKDNFIVRLFRKIKKLFINSPNEYYK